MNESKPAAIQDLKKFGKKSDFGAALILTGIAALVLFVFGGK